ncbi:MAG: ATP-binding protein [Verrucomicrobiia bacterium]
MTDASPPTGDPLPTPPRRRLRFSVRSKVIFAVAFTALLVVLATSITGYYLRRNALLEEFQTLTRSIAATGAIGISGEDLALINSNEDAEEPEFLFIREKLKTIQKANGLTEEEIYILRPLDLDKFSTEFVVMLPQPPFIGNEYIIRPENREAFLKVLKEGKPGSTNIYQDDHGTWISGYAPILDRNGKVAAVLEVDAEISRFLVRANAEALTSLGVGMGVFAFALIPGIFLVNRFTSGLRVLKQALDRFDAGQDRVDLSLNTRDELEEVAESFNTMAAKLQESTEKLVESRDQLQATNLSLEQRTLELNRSLQLTNTIMATVQESLFLISRDGKILPGYSAVMEKMFGRSSLENSPFADLIRDRVTAKTFDLWERFMKVLFNEQKTNHLIPKLNPLKEVEIAIQLPDGRMQTKFFSFRFDRVWEDEKITYALVTVEDVTARIALNREIKESAARIERQAELLFGVIHVEPSQLREFISVSRNALEKASASLRDEGTTAGLSPAERQQAYRETIDRLFRTIHRIKGDAALLKVGYYEQKAHDLEDKLQRLRRQGVMDGKDFVPLVLDLSDMMQSFDDMSEVIGRIASMYGSTPPARPEETNGTLNPANLTALARNLAHKHGKLVELNITEFSENLIPPDYQRGMRDILVQMIRNSIVHGIEKPAEREAIGKPTSGTLQLQSVTEGNWLRIIYSDDGRGLDYESLARKAVELDSVRPGTLARLVDSENNQWKLDELNQLIFEPGLSTAAEAGIDAGRGVGLDLVRNTVTSWAGQVSVHTEPGAWCAFVIDLPMSPVKGT